MQLNVSTLRTIHTRAGSLFPLLVLRSAAAAFQWLPEFLINSQSAPSLQRSQQQNYLSDLRQIDDKFLLRAHKREQLPYFSRVSILLLMQISTAAAFQV